jgi:hypothetical protein
MTPCERLIHINERVSRKPEVGGLRVCASVVTPQYSIIMRILVINCILNIHSHVDYSFVETCTVYCTVHLLIGAEPQSKAVYYL